jgi:hypothetical protein
MRSRLLTGTKEMSQVFPSVNGARARESISATRASQTRQSRTRRGRGVLFQACEGKAALRGPAAGRTIFLAP